MMCLAWHVEALHRAKRLPKLKTLMMKQSSDRRQTWQEQRAIMGQWAEAQRKIAEARAAARKKR